MANDLIVYCVVHQPRRLKLPAQPIPRGAAPEDIERCLFDERMNERYFRKVARSCYYPATRAFLDLVEEGFKLSIGFSASFLLQAERWDQELLALFQRLVRHPNVEPVGVEPNHSFILLVDLERFIQRLRGAGDHVERLFGKRPTVTDTTEMCMSEGIYHSVDRAGFRGALMDGRPWVLGWREPTHLYHGGRELKLLTRHYQLSDDVGYRFASRNWSAWPLTADEYSRWLRETPGDFVFLAWDYETFGEHHRAGTGIFEFLRWLPIELRARGIGQLNPGEAIARYGGEAHHLPLPALPTTWAGRGDLEFFLGNAQQQALFQLMLSAYSTALLTGNERIVETALWLLQSDNLHVIQWYGHGGPESSVSAYFTPGEWWPLGPEGIIREQQQLYRNFIHSLDPYL